jgi:hypothetical protein
MIQDNFPSLQMLFEALKCQLLHFKTTNINQRGYPAVYSYIPTQTCTESSLPDSNSWLRIFSPFSCISTSLAKSDIVFSNILQELHIVSIFIGVPPLQRISFTSESWPHSGISKAHVGTTEEFYKWYIHSWKTLKYCF